MARIVIVDDQEENRRLASYLLKRQGYDVVEAASAVDAMELVLDHLPDLVLIDLHMPVVDGLTLARTLKAIPATAHIPLLLWSVSGSRVERESVRSGDGPFAGFLDKAYDPQVFLQHVEGYLVHHPGLSPASPASPTRVVVVDDRPASLERVRGALAGAGYEVSVTTDPARVLDLVREVGADLVVIDIDMPIVTGTMLVHRLQDAEDLAHIPIALLAGSGVLIHGASTIETFPLVQKPGAVAPFLSQIHDVLEGTR